MVETVVIPEGEYDLLQNEDNEILMAIRARMGNVEDPHILYDGGDTVLFYRNNETNFFIEAIPTTVRKLLSEVTQLLMIEVHDDQIVSEYTVPVRKVAKLPSRS
ncbi:MAG: hypothetical protein ILP11_03320 [Alphaproteobacteria bacterium]|nr:hypothetical protein [Alphaproteobacteria bacterium]